ncbi:hypothetical protein BJ912DRAFT_1078067 [Pholiota molesta]|nr:hypothetical protein BJ912DRAFT_1078067 [Pholiota molesta]
MQPCEAVRFRTAKYVNPLRFAAICRHLRGPGRLDFMERETTGRRTIGSTEEDYKRAMAQEMQNLLLNHEDPEMEAEVQQREREMQGTQNSYEWLLGMLGMHSLEELNPPNKEAISTSQERLARQQAHLLEIWSEPKWAVLDFWPLCLVDGVERPEYDRTGARLLNEWLERSKELLLTIVCRRERERPLCAYRNRYTASLFWVLAQQAHRWRQVDMFVPFLSTVLLNDEWAPYKDEEELEPDAMLKTLETASLCAIGPNGEGGPGGAFLQNARNLRKL